jgi:hypothetical protein
MDAETIRAGISASQETLRQLGFELETCLLDYGATAESTFRAALAERSYDYVMIGAGVRLDPALTHLLEVLVNVTRELAPRAVIVFNTGPHTTAEAVQRWYPAPTPLVDPREGYGASSEP